MFKEWLQHHKRGAIIIAAVIAVWALAMTRAVFAFRDADGVYRGVSVGGQDMSGLTREDVRERLIVFQQSLATQGFTFVYQDGDTGDRRAVVYPLVFKPDGTDSRVFADIDVDATTDLVWGAGRRRTWGLRALERLRIMGYAYQVPAVVTVDEDTFRAVLRANIERDERPARDARAVYEEGGGFRMESEQMGVVYDVDSAIARAVQNLANLTLKPITVERRVDAPRVTRADVEPLLPHLPSLVKSGDVALTYEDATQKITQTWKLKPEQAGPLVAVTKDAQGAVRVGLDSVAFGAWLQETVASDVEVEIRDAKFRVEGNRVIEFQSSRPGVAIDANGAAAAIDEALNVRLAALRSGVPAPTSSVKLAVRTVEPKIQTGDVNTLGIREPLGTGISSFRGSPANRIKNIRNGVNKLNGLLIKPDEEFSLLNALRPFTLAGGYVPELVIKGDKIIPEIGGGLCQLGTTTFRMAMNSGMPITQRTNHGLVVTYYNDPSNNNPGTDATIYDPAPDFRFKNDTGNYLLFVAEMDMKKSELRFTLWGTSDGRKGSYTAPVVHGWIATGPMKEIETLDLEPGKRKCQSRHPGASTSFTYTVALPDGTKKDTVYKSYYRPLPEICQVGVEALSTDAAAPAEGEQPPAEALPVPVE
ncbi:MAG: VanW family protein [Patescibacteria group bacterium]